MIWMGHVLNQAGEYREAREHAVAALQEDAQDEDALRLLGAVKARKNPFLGLWWRYEVWMASMQDKGQIAVLLIAFVVYRVMTLVLADFGLDGAASIVRYAWLAIVAYTWVSPGIFKRMLEKDLEEVRLRDDY